MTDNEDFNKIKEIITKKTDKSKLVKVCHYLLFGRYKIMTKVTFADNKKTWIK